MNILEYIDELIDNGMSEEDAMRCADVALSDNWDTGDDWELFDEYGEELTMRLNEDELRTVCAVFNEILYAMPYREVNKYIGNITLDRAQELYNKLEYVVYGPDDGFIEHE